MMGVFGGAPWCIAMQIQTWSREEDVGQRLACGELARTFDVCVGGNVSPNADDVEPAPISKKTCSPPFDVNLGSEGNDISCGNSAHQQWEAANPNAPKCEGSWARTIRGRLAVASTTLILAAARGACLARQYSLDKAKGFVGLSGGSRTPQQSHDEPQLPAMHWSRS